VPVVSGAEKQSGSLSPLPMISMGGIPATVLFAGLVAPGEFQFNVIVPASVPSGDNAILATYNGAEASPVRMITVSGAAPAPTTSRWGFRGRVRPGASTKRRTSSTYFSSRSLTNM
jgi:hypothetical protein